MVPILRSMFAKIKSVDTRRRPHSINVGSCGIVNSRTVLLTLDSRQRHCSPVPSLLCFQEWGDFTFLFFISVLLRNIFHIIKYTVIVMG